MLFVFASFTYIIIYTQRSINRQLCEHCCTLDSFAYVHIASVTIASTYQGNSSANTFQFRFQPDLRKEDVLMASLGIYIRRHPNTRFDNQPTIILLYRLGRRERVMAKRRPIQISGTSVNQWYHFNFRSIVHEWLDDPASNFGLEVLVADSNGNPLAVVNPTNPNDEPFKP